MRRGRYLPWRGCIEQGWALRLLYLWWYTSKLFSACGIGNNCFIGKMQMHTMQ